MLEEHIELHEEVSAKEFTEELDKLWEKLSVANSDVRGLAAEVGISSSALDELAQEKRERIISVTKEGDGLDPVTTGLLIAAGTKVATDLWEKVLLPLIRQKLGVNAVSRKKKR